MFSVHAKSTADMLGKKKKKRSVFTLSALVEDVKLNKAADVMEGRV